jgi:Flp pilus assembly protein TadD
MSVLIEALRSAEAARGAAGIQTEAPPAPPLEAPRLHAAPRVRRLGAIAAVATAGALGVAWWWLQTETMAPPPAAAVPAPQAQRSAPSEGPAEPSAPPATEGAAPADPPVALVAPAPKPKARATPRAVAATRDEAAPAAATPASTAAAAAPLVERSGQPLPLEAAYRALREGRYEEAHRLYQTVIAAQPGLADAWLGLAAADEGRGDVAGAIAAYRRALQLDPDNAEALAALAELTAAGNPSAQASVLRAALARKPDAPSLHAALGRLLAAENRWSEARGAFEAAAALAPARAAYAFNLAVALDRLGDAARAAAWYERAAVLAEREGAAGVDAAAARARGQQLAALKD